VFFYGLRCVSKKKEVDKPSQVVTEKIKPLLDTSTILSCVERESLRITKYVSIKKVVAKINWSGDKHKDN
jgi:hypothetical protein